MLLSSDSKNSSFDFPSNFSTVLKNISPKEMAPHLDLKASSFLLELTYHLVLWKKTLITVPSFMVKTLKPSRLSGRPGVGKGDDLNTNLSPSNTTPRTLRSRSVVGGMSAQKFSRPSNSSVILMPWSAASSVVRSINALFVIIAMFMVINLTSEFFNFHF
uniref:Uncharacterized protein n=1 Tax=Diadromus pulchellus ascovirus 4a TaxID=158683 RepID=Q9DST9_9VIRU|nr:hypothetical protein [Diadromus pulchellus ascovirus 4a]